MELSCFGNKFQNYILIILVGGFYSGEIKVR